MQPVHTGPQMLTIRPPPVRTPASRALLCLLLVGALLHGQAQVLRHLLGAAHWHAPLPAQVDPVATQQHATAWAQGLAALRTLRQDALARSPLVGGHAAQDHHHDGNVRHHHGPDDTTVVALEPLHDRDPAPSDGASGSLLQPLGLTAGLAWRLPQAVATRWPAAADPGWRDAHLRLPERPPRA